MAQKVLKFNIKFFCSSVEDICEYKDRVESFFKNCHGKDSKHEVRCEVVTEVSQKIVFVENIYRLSVVLSYSDVEREVELDIYVSEICQKWCNYASESRKFVYWLMPLRNKHYYYESSQDRLMKTSELAFGTMPDMGNFVKHYRYQEKSNISEIMCSFYHSQRYFIVNFKPSHNLSCNSKQHYVFRVTYESLVRVIVNITPELGPTQIYFTLNYPPEVRVRIENDTDSPSVSSLADAGQYEYTSERYERTLEFGCQCKNHHFNIKRLGKSPILKLVMSDNYRVRHVVHRMIQRCSSETEFYYSGIQTNIVDVYSLKGFSSFPFINTNQLNQSSLNSVAIFNCQYAWNAVLCYSWVVQDQLLLIQNSRKKDVVKVIQNKLRMYALCNSTALCKTLFSISEIISRNAIFYFEKALDDFFQFFCNSENFEDLPDGMCFARRIIITPSRTLYLPPTEHFDNRVIRKYGVEYMLRLSVLDDNYKPLSFALHYSNREKYMEKVVKEILMHGIKIGRRHYEVLASSNSQLRDHGIWLYAKDNLQNTSSSIREWMGNFDELKNIAKYMARMGQCFSSSEEAVQFAIDDKNEFYLNDITTIDRKYIFSDGIGTISSELANEVRQALRKKISNTETELYEPCAFQIRYKGCKGMVVEDPNLVGRLIGIRPSMMKFKCTTSRSLEIVKVSAPRQVFLNRPLITIFEQLGVPCSVFLNLEKEMILNFIDSLSFTNCATTILSQLLKFNIPYSELQDSGFNFMSDGFFRSLLLTSHRNAVERLRKKSRIAVPINYGRNMLGVLDETKSLKYGQIFVQYSEHLGSTKSNLKVVEGTVVVTKNPCMHPGDVRKFEAVNVSSLKYIKDCIVFPSSGKRPHPDEMAGSDLDGDEYVVIWYPDLIFSKPNFPPMVYPIYSEVTSEKKFDVQDMVDFFCRYIMNDNIGIFGNAHLTWADHHPEGIFSRVCLGIAKKYPSVLDFAKTGKTERLVGKEKPHEYPDFMEKRGLQSSYYSTKALGVLYRITRHLQESVNKIKSSCVISEFDPYLIYPGWEEYKESAEAHKSSYNFYVKHILEKFCINNEADAFCGYFQGNVFNQSRYEKSNLSSIVMTYMADIWYKYRCKFFEDSNKEFMEKQISPEERNIKLYRRASAWYMIVYKDNIFMSGVFSMPWTVADILCKVRIECLKGHNQEVSRDLCFLSNTEQLCVTQFSFTNLSLDTDTVYCSCLVISREILKLWITKTAFERKECCQEWLKCFSRKFDLFFETLGTSHGKECISGSVVSYSHIKIIIDFLKFCFFSPTTSNKYNINLQNASLQTLSNLAITHDLRYLGLKYEESHNKTWNDIDSASDSELEGDEIRISVKMEEDRNFLSSNLEAVKNYLKVTSGVTEIFISTDCDRHNNWFLIINSIGKSWQRYDLEDIVLDVNLFKNLEKVIQNSNK